MRLPPLTAEQLRIIREGWAAGKTEFELCAEAGITVDTFRERRRNQLADLPKRPPSNGSANRGVDPSPEEIRKLTERIRAGWEYEDWLRR
jgi:hypothetical protein